MTLHTFLQRIAPAPAPTLRQAITAALLVERPTTAESYARFYQRVLAELDRPLPVSTSSTRASHAA